MIGPSNVTRLHNTTSEKSYINVFTTFGRQNIITFSDRFLRSGSSGALRNISWWFSEKLLKKRGVEAWFPSLCRSPRKKTLPLRAIVVTKLSSFTAFSEFLDGNNIQLVKSDATHADIKICAYENLLLWLIQRKRKLENNYTVSEWIYEEQLLILNEKAREGAFKKEEKGSEEVQRICLHCIVLLCIDGSKQSK